MLIPHIHVFIFIYFVSNIMQYY